MAASFIRAVKRGPIQCAPSRTAAFSWSKQDNFPWGTPCARPSSITRCRMSCECSARSACIVSEALRIHKFSLQMARKLSQEIRNRAPPRSKILSNRFLIIPFSHLSFDTVNGLIWIKMGTWEKFCFKTVNVFCRTNFAAYYQLESLTESLPSSSLAYLVRKDR